MATGAGNFFHPARRGEAAEIKEDLICDDQRRQIIAIKRVLASMTVGRDMSGHFNDVTRLLSSPNLEVKKLVYLYMVHNARSQPEKAVLHAGTFVRDTQHESPLIRGIALRTMSSIGVEAMSDFVFERVTNALKDSDPYVRKTAAVAVLKLFYLSRQRTEEGGVLEQLHELLSDSNHTVVAAAVATISELRMMGAPARSLVLSPTNATTLLSALPDCSEWGQLYILEGLGGFRASDHGEAEMIVERILPQLQHSNPAVVLAATKLVILYLDQWTAPSSSLPQLQKDEKLKTYSAKIAQPLVSMVTGIRFEIRYITLRNIKLFLQRFPDLLTPYVKSFLVKYDDPIYIKLEKVDVLVALANADNAATILTELAEYATEIDIQFVRKAVRCIGLVAVKVEAAAPHCVDKLVALIKSRVNYVVQESIVVLQTLFRQFPNQYEGVIPILCSALETLDEPDSKAAMVWVIGEYSDRIDNARDILEIFLDNFEEEVVKVRLAVLTAVIKLYLKRGDDPKNQEVLERVLAMCTNSDVPDIRDRAYFCWRCILQDPTAAMKILLCKKDPIAEGAVPKLERPLLAQLLNESGCLSSVFHRPAASVLGDGSRAPVFYEEQDEDLLVEPDIAAAEAAAGAAATAAGVAGEAVPRTVPTVPQPNALDSIFDDVVGPSVSGAETIGAHAAISAPLPQPHVELHTALSAQTGKGLSIKMGWTPLPEPSVVVEVALNSSASGPSCKITQMQLNVNIFGLGLAQDLPPIEVTAGGKPVQVTVPVNCANQRKPVRDIQVAAATSLYGVLFFVAPHVPLSLVLNPATPVDPAEYVGQCRRLNPSDDWVMPAGAGPICPARDESDGQVALAPDQLLRAAGLYLVHAQPVAAQGTTPAAVAHHIHASTIGGARMFAEVTMTRTDASWAQVTSCIVRSNDASLAPIFADHLIATLSDS